MRRAAAMGVAAAVFLVLPWQAVPVAGEGEVLSVTVEGLPEVDGGSYQVWVDGAGGPRLLGDLEYAMGWTGSFMLSQADFEAASAVRVVLDYPMAGNGSNMTGNMSTMSTGGSVTVLTADPAQGAMAAFLAPFYGAAWMAVSGKYVLATPTNGPDSDERAGVWFLNAYGGGPPEPSLALPPLDMTDWTYEAWVAADDMSAWFSVGRFTHVDGPDDACAYCGPDLAPPFPGEDLLQGLPGMLHGPLDLRGARVAVTVEPLHDPAPGEPFAFPALEATVPSDAVDHELYNLTSVTANFAGGSIDYMPLAAAPAQSPTPGAGALMALAALGGVTVGFVLWRGARKAR